MKVAIDISPLSSGHKVRGVGSYVNLIKNNIEKYDKENTYIFFEGKVPSDIDVVHYPYFDPFFSMLPFKNKVKTVVTVHDLTPIKFKKHFPAGIKGSLKWKYNKMLLKKADLIIVDSQASKKDVIEIAGVKEKKVKVVYLASNPIYKKLAADIYQSEMKKKYGFPEEFMIYVGDVTWNKNLPRIIEASKKAGINLLLIGKALAETNFDKNNPWNRDRVRVNEMIKNEKKIKVLGFIPDEELLGIYNLAKALLMPSLYEGFGLPVLEAMNCGCPVITSREGSLPEVGGEAVYYVDAKSVDSIIGGINKLSKDEKLRKELSQKGLAQAKIFSIEKTIKATVSAFHQA